MSTSISTDHQADLFCALNMQLHEAAGNPLLFEFYDDDRIARTSSELYKHAALHRYKYLKMLIDA